MPTYLRTNKNLPSFSRLVSQDDIYDLLRGQNKTTKYFERVEQVFWFLVLLGFKNNRFLDRSKQKDNKTRDAQHYGNIKENQELLILTILFKHHKNNLEIIEQELSKNSQISNIIHSYSDGGVKIIEEHRAIKNPIEDLIENIEDNN